MIRSAAIAMDCRPEEQNRLIVIAATLTGRPARSDAIRATFIPCSPSGVAQPIITSSISAGSSPFARTTASLITCAARSSGLAARSVPFGALPTAVRTELTITASRMAHLGRCGALQRHKLLHWMPLLGKKQPRGRPLAQESCSGTKRNGRSPQRRATFIFAGGSASPRCRPFPHITLVRFRQSGLVIGNLLLDPLIVHARGFGRRLALLPLGFLFRRRVELLEFEVHPGSLGGADVGIIGGVELPHSAQPKVNQAEHQRNQ